MHLLSIENCLRVFNSPIIIAVYKECLTALFEYIIQLITSLIRNFEDSPSQIGGTLLTLAPQYPFCYICNIIIYALVKALLPA